MKKNVSSKMNTFIMHISRMQQKWFSSPNYSDSYNVQMIICVSNKKSNKQC